MRNRNAESTPSKQVSDFYCSDLSRQAGEAIFGTAPRVDVWFLLEYNGLWQKKAFEQSDLPAPTRQALSAYFDAVPNSRLLLISQQHPSVAPERSRLYVAFAAERDPTLYRFDLASYEDVLSLDVTAMRSGAPVYQVARCAEPLFLVCTNGERDRCCARAGLPVYRALAQAVGGAAWQCTHVGGHRYAANVLCFPHGVYYGYVGTEDVGPLVETYRRGRVILPNYRGRSCYRREVQAAEYFLRAETGIADLEAFRLVSVERSDDNGWTVTFEAQEDGVRHRIHGQTDPAALLNYLSCGEAEPAPVPQYRLIGHERMTD